MAGLTYNDFLPLADISDEAGEAEEAEEAEQLCQTQHPQRSRRVQELLVRSDILQQSKQLLFKK